MAISCYHSSMNSKSLSALIVRLPESLHRVIKKRAERLGISLNRYCVNLLQGDKKSEDSSRGATSSSFLGLGTDCNLPLDELSSEILRAFPNEVEGIVLFGSWARGDVRSSSDIDLLVVLRPEMHLDRDVYSRLPTRHLNGHEVSPLFVQLPKDPEEIRGVWFEIALDGLVLYDRNLVLSSFLSRVRNFIADGRVQRLLAHGHPYWIHVNSSKDGIARIEA